MILCRCGHARSAHADLRRLCCGPGCSCPAFARDFVAETEQLERELCTTHEPCRLIELAELLEQPRAWCSPVAFRLLDGAQLVPCRKLVETFCRCGDPLVIARAEGTARFVSCARRDGFEGMLDQRHLHDEVQLP